MNIVSEKSRLREKNLAKREAIALADRAAWSHACNERIYQTIHSVISRTGIIAGYLPIKTELDVLPALTWLGEANHTLALPVMGKEEGRRQLTFHPWKPGEKLTRKTYGIHEPDGDKAVVIPDVVIVPLLAFDRRGHRLGYGAGYYDAVLRKLRAVQPAVVAIGASFSLQEEEGLPAEAYDETLNKIITEKEVIHIR